MARVLGIDIPNEKRIVISLQYIYGIGPTTAKNILAAAGVSEDTRTKNLTEDEYSYHISLFRGFSIFLNRYCFFYAINNKSDIIKGCEYIKNNKLMPNYDQCFHILFSEMSFKLFKLFS